MTAEAPAAAQTSFGSPILSAVDVSKEFGGLVAVNQVSVDIPLGSIVSIIGPNGAGKTTFFNMLTGLYKSSGGRIVFSGRDIPRSTRRHHEARGCAHVPEHPAVRRDDRARERDRGAALQDAGGVVRVDRACAVGA